MNLSSEVLGSSIVKFTALTVGTSSSKVGRLLDDGSVVCINTYELTLKTFKSVVP